MADSTHIRFDGWTLARGSGELRRDGKTQRLPPQPLATLIELLDHAGEVVTREALVKILWPKGIVDFDNSLNAVVRKLRVVLGDDSETPRYIETLPRIGYRFIGKVEADAPPPAPAPALPVRPGWVSRRNVILAMIAMAAAAVLWFAVSSRQPPAATVTASPQFPKRTTSERAYEHYLQGTFNRSRRDINGTEKSIANFKAALEEDPYYADAWAGLAETYSGAAMSQYMPTVQAYEQARIAALRAVELDDDSGHAHSALAHITMMFDRDLARAQAEAERARELDPGYARNWHAFAILRAYQGRMPEALDMMRRARALEPMTLLYASNYGLLLFNARRYDDAIAHSKELLGSQPRNDQARSVLIRSLVAKGEIDAALEQLQLRISERPNLADAGFVYAHAGNRAGALAEIARIEQIGKGGFGVGYDIAIIQAALGDGAAGCTALERTLTDHSLVVLWMRVDPRMDPLRKEACFGDVMKRLYGSN